MGAKAKLDQIVDALENQFDDISAFVNLDTGEVEEMPHDVLRDVEETDEDEWDEALEGLPQ